MSIAGAGRLAIVLAVLGAPLASGQRAEAEGEAGRRGVIDPRADELLRSMSRELAGMGGFRMSAEQVFEVIEPGGQKLHYARRLELEAQRPDALRATSVGDEWNKEYWYDGTSVTIFDRETSVYSTVPAPGSIDEMFDHMHATYGLTVPTVELLFSDPYATLMEGVRAGRYVGLHGAGERDCHHLAFVQAGVDWELWIDAGERPLPRKLIVTYKDQPGSPDFTARFLRWEPLERGDRQRFRFQAPDGAERVEMLPVEAETDTEGDG